VIESGTWNSAMTWSNAQLGDLPNPTFPRMPCTTAARPGGWMTPSSMKMIVPSVKMCRT
jgi:hypothetical protein